MKKLAQYVLRALCAVALMGSTACTVASATSSNAKCEDVPRLLEEARKDLDSKKGGPDEKKADDVVKALEDRQKQKECASTPEPIKTADVEKGDGTTISLPVVDGGNPANPITGVESNRDPRTPPVRGDGQQKQVVGSWSQLNDVRGSDAAYTQCVDERVGMTWGTDVPKFVQTEQAVRPDGSRLGARFVLAVNTTATPELVLEKARQDSPDLPADAHIVRVTGFINTRNFNNGGCDAFWDTRSMVRVSLGVVLYDAAGNPIGLDADPAGTRARGVFVDCHNPWILARKPPVIVVTPAAPPQPGAPPAAGSPPPRRGNPPGTSPPGTSPPGTSPPGTSPPRTTATTVPGRKPVATTLAPPPTVRTPATSSTPTTRSAGNSGPGAPPTGGTTPPTVKAPSSPPATTGAPIVREDV